MSPPLGRRGSAAFAAAGAGIAVTAGLLQARRTAAESARRRSGGERGSALTVRGADGTALQVRAHGPLDAPPLVLVHCWTGTQELWHYIVDALDGEFRIITYDHRGHGISGKAGADAYTLAALASDLQAVLEATVEPGRKAVLGGHSLGAMTIVQWAGMHRAEVADRIAAVALMSTGMGDLTADHAFVGRLPGPFDTARGRIADLVLASPMPIKALPVPVASVVASFAAFGPHPRPGDVELTARMALDCRPAARGGCGRAMARMDLYDSIAAVSVPSLVVAGKRDLMTPRSHTERLCEALPGCSGTLLAPDAGHMTPLEAHELVSDAIRGLAAHRDAPARPAAARRS